MTKLPGVTETAAMRLVPTLNNPDTRNPRNKIETTKFETGNRNRCRPNKTETGIGIGAGMTKLPGVTETAAMRLTLTPQQHHAIKVARVSEYIYTHTPLYIER